MNLYICDLSTLCMGLFYYRKEPKIKNLLSNADMTRVAKLTGVTEVVVDIIEGEGTIVCNDSSRGVQG